MGNIDENITVLATALVSVFWPCICWGQDISDNSLVVGVNDMAATSTIFNGETFVSGEILHSDNQTLYVKSTESFVPASGGQFFGQPVPAYVVSEEAILLVASNGDERTVRSAKWKAQVVVFRCDGQLGSVECTAEPSVPILPNDLMPKIAVLAPQTTSNPIVPATAQECIDFRNNSSDFDQKEIDTAESHCNKLRPLPSSNDNDEGVVQNDHNE